MKYCPQCGTTTAEQEIGGQLRTVCQSSTCEFIDWRNPTPVVAAIIEYQNQVLLVHNRDWPPKMLGLVSGFLEAEEHPEDAIKREIKEETNLDTQLVEFIGHYPFKQQNQILMVYAAQCSGEIKLNEELDRYKLLSRSKLIPWEFGTGPAVRDWLALKSCTKSP